MIDAATTRQLVLRSNDQSREDDNRCDSGDHHLDNYDDRCYRATTNVATTVIDMQ